MEAYKTYKLNFELRTSFGLGCRSLSKLKKGKDSEHKLSGALVGALELSHQSTRNSSPGNWKLLSWEPGAF